jgi:hypothetical protein
MKATENHFRIFDLSIRSTILLPELDNSTYSTKKLSFAISSNPPSETQEPFFWLYHWSLPNGEKIISIAKWKNFLILRFHDLADFFFCQKESRIVCYPNISTPLETIRHLLLDQVIPRVLSYLGRPVIHASCSLINNSCVLFLGETGWGKSTIGAFLHQEGFPLLGDDAVLLKKAKRKVIGIASYAGIRLLRDSFKSLYFDNNFTPTIAKVSHYSSKKRIIYSNSETKLPIEVPIKAFFVLNNPATASPSTPVTITPLTGYRAAIEITKHCFQADPTDGKIVGSQLRMITNWLSSSSVPIFNLNFQRDHRLLRGICEEITSFVTSLA